MQSELRSKPIVAVRNAWVPDPPRWVNWLDFIRHIYINRVLSIQACAGYPLSLGGKRRVAGVVAKENFNKFQRSISNISAPRGMRRAVFEAEMQRRIEGYLRQNGAAFASRQPGGVVLLFFVIGSIAAAAACVAAPLLTAATAAIISFIIVIAAQIIVQFPRARNQRISSSFIVALYISAGSWAGVQIFAGGESSPLWRVILLFLLFGLGAAAAAKLIVASVTTAVQRLFYVRGGLDNYILAFFLDLFHYITDHREDWGTLAFQRDVNSELSLIADLVEAYLPGRLSATERRSRRERRGISNGIARAIRSHSDDVMRQNGRNKLRQMINSYITLIYRGAWLELPREQYATRLETVLKVARPLTASLIPVAVMLCLRLAKVVTGDFETYGWLFASLWFAVSLGTWIDPGLAERLKVMNSMITLFRGKDE